MNSFVWFFIVGICLLVGIYCVIAITFELHEKKCPDNLKNKPDSDLNGYDTNLN